MVPILEKHVVEALIWRPGVDNAGLAINENALKGAISQLQKRLPSVVGVDFRKDSRPVGVVTKAWFDDQVKGMVVTVELTDDAGMKWASYNVADSLRPMFFIDNKYKSQNTGFDVVTQCRIAQVDMLVLNQPSALPDPYRLYA